MPRSRIASGVLVVVVSATACAPDRSAATSSTSTDASSSGTDSDGDPAEPMLPPRPATQSCRFDGQAPGLLPPLGLTPLFAPEALAEVVDVIAAGDRVLLAERGGRVFVGDAEELAPLEPVADLGDRGRIVALAPAPEFAATGHLFVRYEAASGLPRAVIARFTIDLASWTLDLASERVVMELADAVGERSGGALVFDAAGMLVIGVGDLGEPSRAQDPSGRMGKLLRVDVGPIEVNGAPGIPADNPFIGLGGDAGMVWALGLRDPWRCASAGAGALWCVDVGELEQEVDRVTAGANLGWPHVEGGACRLPGGDCSDLDVVHAAATYRSNEGDCAIAGALFGVSTELDATLVYADRCSGRLRGVDTADPGVVVQEEILAVEPAGIVALGRDDEGRPLAITGDARVARIVVAPPAGEFPQRLSDSGCFADLAALAPVPGVVPYGVNADLWTDGAIKARHIALPAGATITIADDGAFAFPTGSVLLKTFSFEFAAGDPASRRPVETRVMVRREHGWQFHSYKWRVDGSDADLLVAGESALLELDEHGVDVKFEYLWPSRGNCKMCHGFGASQALGPRLDQLNGEHDYGDASANQLLVLDKLGMFAAPLPGPPEALPRIPGPEDPESTLEPRARGYLHTNCGHCHRPDGWTPPELTMDLRWTTPLADTRTCGVPAQYSNPWAEGTLRIAPGDPDASVIWERIHQRGLGQMPPLGTSLLDPRATVVHEWIAQLSACP